MTTAVKLYRRSELEAIDDGCLYRYQRIWRAGDRDESDLATVGIAFHHVKFLYIQRLLEKQLPSDSEEAQAAFTEGVAAVLLPSRLIPELRQLWEFHVEGWALSLDRFVAAEERQTSGSVTWAPDLVYAHPTNELEIQDWKSGWAPAPTEFELKQNFQSRVYSAYARTRWSGFTSYRFTVHAVRWNRSTSVVFTNAELDAVERELEAHIATIEEAERRNEWPAVAGPACEWCQLACPLMDQVQAIPKRLIEEKDAKAVAGWSLVAKQMIKQADQALKGYYDAHGPIMVNGIEWAKRPVIERKYPVSAVLQVLTARNVLGVFDENPDATVSHSALSRVIKAFPQIASDLAPFAQEKISYRFSAKKPGTSDEEGDPS